MKKAQWRAPISSANEERLGNRGATQPESARAITASTTNTKSNPTCYAISQSIPPWWFIVSGAIAGEWCLQSNPTVLCLRGSNDESPGGEECSAAARLLQQRQPRGPKKL